MYTEKVSVLLFFCLWSPAFLTPFFPACLAAGVPLADPVVFFGVKSQGKSWWGLTQQKSSKLLQASHPQITSIGCLV